MVKMIKAAQYAARTNSLPSSQLHLIKERYENII